MSNFKVRGQDQENQVLWVALTLWDGAEEGATSGVIGKAGTGIRDQPGYQPRFAREGN